MIVGGDKNSIFGDNETSKSNFKGVILKIRIYDIFMFDC